jgi:2-dehydro-3-deoxyphosphogluconate aldolase/(4S)-4-hydroxy-2-oxoglutarate aldolase
LLAAASKGSIPFLPGTASASDVMAAMEAGFSRFKLFPAENVGGVGLLKSLGGPLAAARFCPTGGITLESAPRYLALSNVACVGGSWIAPADLLTAGKFDEIKARAKAASALTRGAA